MQYEFGEIAHILQSVVFGAIPKHTVIDLSIDSRKSSIPFRTVFFALKTERNNAHRYIADLYKNDIHHFIVSEDIETSQYPLASFIRVPNTLEALQRLASYHRSMFQIPIIGVTGSNGKTIIKEWLNAMLKLDHFVCRSPKSYNSQIGVPLSVLRLEYFHQLAIFEAGISQKDEMIHLQRIIQPTLGILTNIGSQHNDGFSNQQEKLQEKLTLFSQCEKIIAHPKYISYDQLDDKRFVFWAYETENLPVKYSISFEGRQIIINQDLSYTTLEILNEASKENLIHCIITLLELNIDPATIQRRIRAIIPLSMRLEMQEGIHNCSIINDAYSNDLDSLRIALDFQADQKHHVKNTLFISDIEESGLDKIELLEKVHELISQYPLQKIFLVTEYISENEKLYKDSNRKIFIYKNTEALLLDLPQIQFSNENILIKGARNFQFEKIAFYFRKKTHKTALHINLNALIHNLNEYRKLLQPSTKVMVMVKALSYGSGTYEIASLLQNQKVDYLSVAYIDEGVELREKGINLPIMVMNVDEQGIEDLIHFRLEPEIYSIAQLELIYKKLEDLGLDDQVEIPIHIKIDTGMHRLGFVQSEIQDLITYLREHSSFQIISCMSHLAGSDEQEHDGFTAEQVRSFNNISDQICAALDITCMRHILNSAGISRLPQYQMDMVRLGIGLYGCDVSDEIADRLQPVSMLMSYVLQIRNVKKGDSIGYSRRGIAQRDMRLATVAIGYADGLPRSLSNGAGKMYIQEKYATIIGNVCMDMTMVDVTEIPDVEVGDEVEVFGSHPTVMQLAQWSQTISYEILTGISTRVKRIYFKE